MAAMHCQPEGCTHPPPPVPPFLLVRNLSSKRIVPTDNMQPKTDNAKRHHRVKPLGYLHLKVSTIEHKLPAAIKAMPATSWKHPASLPLSAEACQLTTSIRSISPPYILHSPSPFNSPLTPTPYSCCVLMYTLAYPHHLYTAAWINTNLLSSESST